MRSKTFTINIPLTPLVQQAIRFAQAVQQHAVTNPALKPRAFLVGGAVRDIILQTPPADIDMEVYHLTHTQLDKSLHATYGKLAVKTYAYYGIWEVRTQDGLLNVSMPRTEVQTGTAHTDLAITLDPDLTYTQALIRRDFTMNAILADPLTRDVYDPYHGTEDILYGRLRAVHPPTFPQDALRAWRAIQLIGRYKLTPNKTLLRLLNVMASSPGMKVLSGERIGAECDKLFSPNSVPSRGLAVAQATGLLRARIEPLARLTTDPTTWQKLTTVLDELTVTKGRHKEGWQIILKALNPHERSTLIHQLAIPKKYFRLSGTG